MKRRLPDLREQRGTILLLLLLGLGFNLAWLFIVNVPRGQGLQSADQGVQELRRQLLRRGRSVEDLQRAVERIRNREHTLDLFFAQVLSDKKERMVPFQREIRSIALRHRIDPDHVAYSHTAVDEAADMVRFSANFPLKGSYQALRSFIHDIEHSENFLIIDGIDLGSSHEGGVILSLDIGVSTLFRDKEMSLENQGKALR